MGKKTRRHQSRSCWDRAQMRARQARRSGRNPVLVALLFVMALMSIPSFSFAPASARPRSGSREDWPVSDYERGYSSQKQNAPRNHHGRYVARPSLLRLMRDLRRPAARADAEKALLGRLADADLRAWISAQVLKDRINKLSIFVRPGIPDETVFASWQAALDADNADKADAAEEATARANVLRAIVSLTSTVEDDSEPRPKKS